jgi:putative membrane protein
MEIKTLLVALHVMANLVWIGSIASVGWLVAAAAKSTDRSSAVLARGLYLRVAMPAFLVSFLAGVLRVVLDPAYYMHLHWFHGKVTFALVVIALHHIIGARSRKLAVAAALPASTENPSGSMQVGKSGGILAGALLAFAFLTVVFVIFKQTLVP